MNIKDKIADTLGNEIIGSVKDKKEKERVEKPVPPKKPKKQKKAKKPKPKKEKKPLFEKPKFDFKKNKEEKSKKNFAMQQLEKQEKNRKDRDSKLLDIYNIDKVSNIDSLLTSEDVDNVEFTLIAPTGLDPKEVAKFLNEVSYSISEYVSIIENRDREIKILSKANSELEDKLEDEKQSSDFAQMINNRDNKEAELQEKMLNLQIENENIKNKYNALRQKVKEIENQRMDVVLPTIEQPQEYEPPKTENVDIPDEGGYDGGMSLLDEM